MTNVMMKTADGMAVMSPDVDLKEKASPKVTTEFVVSAGAVTIAATTESEIEVGGEMPNYASPMNEGDTDKSFVVSTSEVQWKDMRPKNLVEKQDNIKTLVNTIIGMVIHEAEVILIDMVKAALIDGYRILKPGQSYSMELDSNRVQVFIDKAGIVQTAEIG